MRYLGTNLWAGTLFRKFQNSSGFETKYMSISFTYRELYSNIWKHVLIFNKV